MSERDSQFCSRELLMRATESDASNPEEQEALRTYQYLTAQLQLETQKCSDINVFINSKSNAFFSCSRNVQEGIRSQLSIQEKHISDLSDEINKLSCSIPLRPVVDKIYKRIIDEDLTRVREEYIAEMNKEADEISIKWAQKYKISEEKLFEERYSQFIATHKNSITLELQSSYDKCRSKLINHIDFGGNVCLPLFVMWALFMMMLPKPVKTITIIFVSAIFVCFAFWVHKYFYSIIDRICSKYFETVELKEILIRYVHKCKNASLYNDNSKIKTDGINAFYEACHERIVNECFCYK